MREMLVQGAAAFHDKFCLMKISRMLTLMPMVRRAARWAGFLGLAALAGCAGVSETAKFYLPLDEVVRDPKPKEAEIPILGRPPQRPHKMIGRLAFSTDRDWDFIRSSILYNARRSGADFAVVSQVQSSQQWRWAQTPPQTDWIPVPGPVVQNKRGQWVYTGVQWVPVYRPGVPYPALFTNTSFVAEMGIYTQR